MKYKFLTFLNIKVRRSEVSERRIRVHSCDQRTSIECSNKSVGLIAAPDRRQNDGPARKSPGCLLRRGYRRAVGWRGRSSGEEGRIGSKAFWGVASGATPRLEGGAAAWFAGILHP